MIQFFPNCGIEEKLELPIFRHSSDIHSKGYLLIRLPFINNDIKEKIEKKIIKGIIASSDCLELYKQFDLQLIHVEDPNLVWAKLCAANFPLQPKHKIAITGTNGKTSTTFFISRVLKELDQPCLLINSNGTYINHEKIHENINSTPDALVIHQALHQFAQQYPDGFAIMESTSIAICDKRISQIKFDIGFLLNLTVDHLDYHLNLKNYLDAKMQLSKQCEQFFVHTSINRKKHRKFGTQILHCSIKNRALRLKLKIDDKIFTLNPKLLGVFNAQNILAGILALKKFFPTESFINFFNLVSPPAGRMQFVAPNVIVDFAHSDDALNKVIKAIQQTKPRKFLIVMGCGGNRDKSKRAKIGKILNNFKNNAIITNDNPRDENPMEIIKAIQEQAPQAIIIENRRDAIEYALRNTDEKDICLIAGRGDEKFQKFENGREIPFHDATCVQEIIHKSN
jgi:UDP-N-acetylmuramyl tripeptide synthase